jgi:phosphoribosylanthranilate isomerase
MHIQIKICGLTDATQARACAEAGADAIGLVFHEASPRNVSVEQARGIVETLPQQVVPVGVFVGQSGEEIAEIAREAGLRTVQLHGPTMLSTGPIRAAGLRIVRVLFDLHLPESLPDADAFLIECGRGVLPGGNALTWDWGAARSLIAMLPLPCGLAGGLAPENVAGAVDAAGAAAVDASSSVESSPGVKDITKVRRFVAAVRGRGNWAENDGLCGLKTDAANCTKNNFEKTKKGLACF